MIGTEKYSAVRLPSVMRQFPLDVISMSGNESVDFLQRISTNSFENFSVGNIQKTLLVTDKGRILDAVWVMKKQDDVVLLSSKGMASEIIRWLNRYIIMEEIELSDVTDKFDITVHVDQDNDFFHSDYYGFPVSFKIIPHTAQGSEDPAKSYWKAFELWRIDNGIPMANKELVQDYNPLELNLWDWISFSKGCYIGQEVIARLDTYKKIQRILCKFRTSASVNEGDVLLNNEGMNIGTITSVATLDNDSIGLMMIRATSAAEHGLLRVQGSTAVITIERMFTKGSNGRN